MFCQKCGKEINDEAAVCIHCGCAVKEDAYSKNLSEPKTGIGILMGLFLGISGLIIGLCIYPAGTIARKSFLKAWGITFGVAIAVVVFLFLAVLLISAVGTPHYIPYYAGPYGMFSILL